MPDEIILLPIIIVNRHVKGMRGHIFFFSSFSLFFNFLPPSSKSACAGEYGPDSIFILIIVMELFDFMKSLTGFS